MSPCLVLLYPSCTAVLSLSVPSFEEMTIFLISGLRWKNPRIVAGKLLCIKVNKQICQVRLPHLGGKMPWKPRCIVMSSPPTSTPNSRAFVAATANKSPLNSAFSISRRSCFARQVYPEFRAFNQESDILEHTKSSLCCRDRGNKCEACTRTIKCSCMPDEKWVQNLNGLKERSLSECLRVQKLTVGL